MAKLDEMQVTINWDAANAEATVFAEIPSTLNRLNALCQKHPDSFKLDRVDKCGGHHYTIPKDRVSFRSPVSDALREKNRRRALERGLLPPHRSNVSTETPSTPSDDTE